MESAISAVVSQWGALGGVLILLAYIIWDNWKTNKNRKTHNDKTGKNLDSIHEKLDSMNASIISVDTKFECFKEEVKDDIKELRSEIDNIPANHLALSEEYNNLKQSDHLKQLHDLMKLGPRLHRILKDCITGTNGDHVFVGSFHNGNSTLSGIPYYKFDIIAERFCDNKVEQDCEFAFMYKDSDILRFDTLPIMLVQQDLVHFQVPEEGQTTLANYDDIIWRRMRGRGIKQIALKLLRDSSDSPSGFLGIIKYDLKPLNLDALRTASIELEKEYHASEKREELN